MAASVSLPSTGVGANSHFCRSGGYFGISRAISSPSVILVQRSIFKMACLKLGIIPTSAIKLAVYLNCELFRIGLRELGYL
jgi:hypothetical protein